jgi:hypothetical protein
VVPPVSGPEVGDIVWESEKEANGTGEGDESPERPLRVTLTALNPAPRVEGEMQVTDDSDEAIAEENKSPK